MVTDPKIVRRGPKEFESESVKPRQHAQIELPSITEAWERPVDIVEVDQATINKDYYEQLKFNEEPVTILIHRSGEKFASTVTDLVAVNNIKAEILFKSGWVQVGWLPRGVAFTTKRKYVEQLAHAKVDDVKTNVVEVNGEDPRNLIDRTTRTVCPFSMIEDKNPKGVAWLTSILSQ